MSLKNRKNIVRVLIIILFLFGFYLIDFYYGFIPKVYAADYSSERLTLTATSNPYNFSSCPTGIDWDAILNEAYYNRGLDDIYPYYILYESNRHDHKGKVGLIVAKNIDDVRLNSYSNPTLSSYYNYSFDLVMRHNSSNTQFYEIKPTSCTTIQNPGSGYESNDLIQALGLSTTSSSFTYDLTIHKTNIPLVLQPPFSGTIGFYNDVSINGVDYNIGDIVYNTNGELYVPSLPPDDFPYIFQLDYDVDKQEIMYCIMYLNPDTHILKETFNGGKTWSNLPFSDGVCYSRTLKPGDIYQFKVLDKDDNSLLLISDEYEFLIDDSLYFKSFNFDGTTNNIMYDIFGLDDDIHILQKSFDGGLTWENVSIFPNTCYLDTLKWGDIFQVRVLDKTDGSVLLISNKYSASPITFDDDDDDDPILSPPVVDNWWEWFYPENWGYYIGYYVVKPIIDGFKSVINYLFIPNMDYVEDGFTAIKMTFDEKLPFVSQTVDMLSQLVGYNVPTSYPVDYNPLPKISLPQYNVNNENIIDLTYYSENRETIHNYIRYFAWFIFLISLLKKAPKLISRGGY